ncbi:MAG: N-methylhydantoinase A [Gammaproteobacteria bacterium]|jgi:N-methylhydantoinase A
MAAGASGIAVAFMHRFRNPAHEIAARAAIQKALPSLDISLSSDIWPKIGEYERTLVSVLNADVKPKVGVLICTENCRT